MGSRRTKPAVVMVNSHVARGSVGGRAGVFVLQRMGFPVWWAPTVALPWHAGHGPSTRTAPDEAAFAAFLADLARAPWLDEVGAVMSGYLGEAGQAGPIAALVDAVKAANPDAIYLCDPIVGDSEGLFQPAAVVAAIGGELLPRADILTPNRHELAWLTGAAPSDNAGLMAAARTLRPSEVVVTSAFASSGAIGNLVVGAEKAALVSHPWLADVPHGTGDLLSPLYLAHRLDGLSAAMALERAVSTTLRLIRLALERGDDEMPLVAGQALFDAPSEGVSVEMLDGAPG